MKDKTLGFGVVLFTLLGLLLSFPGMLLAAPFWYAALLLIDEIGE